MMKVNFKAWSSMQDNKDRNNYQIYPVENMRPVGKERKELKSGRYYRCT